MTRVSEQPTPSQLLDAATRASLIADLRRMANWLESHPDATIARHTTAHIQYSVDVSTPAERRREVVADIAGELGLPVLERDGQIYVQHDIGQARYVAATCRPDAPRAVQS